MIRALPLLLLAGCCLPASMKESLEKKASETIVEKALEQADGVESAKVGPDGVQITTDDGTVVDAHGDTLSATGTGDHGDFAFGTGSAAAVPAGFPIPLYPGAAISTSIAQEHGETSVVLTTSDPGSKVVAFYDANLPGAPQRTVLDDGAGGVSLATYSLEQPGGTWTVMVSPSPPQTMVALTLTRP